MIVFPLKRLGIEKKSQISVSIYARLTNDGREFSTFCQSTNLASTCYKVISTFVSMHRLKFTTGFAQ